MHRDIMRSFTQRSRDAAASPQRRYTMDGTGVGFAKSEYRRHQRPQTESTMFHQLLTPVGDSLALSFLVAILPIATVLVLLGVVRRPAWQAALAGLVVGLVIAIAVWGLPARIAFAAAS